MKARTLAKIGGILLVSTLAQIAAYAVMFIPVPHLTLQQFMEISIPMNAFASFAVGLFAFGEWINQ